MRSPSPLRGTGYSLAELTTLQTAYQEIRSLLALRARNGDALGELDKAFEVAMEAHAGMYRKAGEPFMLHPLRVARTVIEDLGLGVTSTICALLHDVVEDTDVSLSTIQARFGPKVANIVDGLTKLRLITKWSSSAQAESFKKLFLTFSQDRRIVLIKLADRLDNMRTLESLSAKQQLKIASETQYIYVPLAHRLGLNQLKSTLEDFCLKHLHPNTYYSVAKKLHEKRSERETFLNAAAQPIIDTLKAKGFDFVIKKRTKSISSIWGKMMRYNINFEEVYDLTAIRIVFDSPLEEERQRCWEIYALITALYPPKPDRLRDWISYPKNNGYEALHTTVMTPEGRWLEVQIRTSRMDSIAEKGIAAHWKYKGPSMGVPVLERWIEGLRDILNKNTSAIEFLSHVKLSLYDEEICVFAHSGTSCILPKGATVFDFACSIHRSKALRCSQGFVNQRAVSIDYPLKNGDQVRVKLESHPQPVSESWLNFANTSIARQIVKERLSKQQRHEEQKGAKVLQKKLAQRKITPTQHIQEQLLTFFDVPSVQELYAAIGRGTITPKEIEQCQLATNPEELATQKPIKQRDQLLINAGRDCKNYVFSACCKPIPGDEVFGLMTTHGVVKIHRTSCPHAVELLSYHGHRAIKARWGYREETFLVAIELRGTERTGLANEVMKLITEKYKLSIQAITFGINARAFQGKIQFLVYNLAQLEAILNGLREVPGITHAGRARTKEAYEEGSINVL